MAKKQILTEADLRGHTIDSLERCGQFLTIHFADNYTVATFEARPDYDGSDAEIVSQLVEFAPASYEAMALRIFTAEERKAAWAAVEAEQKARSEGYERQTYERLKAKFEPTTPTPGGRA